MSFVWFALLALLAVAFVVWPLLRSRGGEWDRIGGDTEQRSALNDALHAEQLEELAAQRAAGEISDAQYQKLKSEANAMHRQDNAIDARSASPRRLGHPRWLVAALALCLPIAASWLYSEWGAAQDWQIQQLSTSLFRLQQRGAALDEVQPTAAVLYEKLSERLQEAPENLNNRFLLARTAVELGDYRSALAAYRDILERQPNSPQVVGEMAQVLFMAAGNQFTPEVQQVFERALEMDPDNTDLLGFAGIGAYQSGKYQLAIDYWQNGLHKLAAGDPRHQTWQRAIAEARRQLADGPGAGQAAQADSQPQAPGAGEEGGSSPSLTVTVSLGEGVEASPQDKVFIYARAWRGPRMPLAMQQVTVADLPITVTLDDSMSMVAGMTMSRFPELEVVARVSPSGQAEARSGDWQASAGPVASGTAERDITLRIEDRLP